MGIRTTEITDDNGNVIILNNSQVNGVCNMSKNMHKQEIKDGPKSETPAIAEKKNGSGKDGK